jgi:hypothetical protein
MFGFMGGMVSGVELRLRGAAVCDVRGVEAVTKTEGKALDNIAPGRLQPLSAPGARTART